ncbi:MFS transporter [Amycolatopsis pigmentata]|uniref:MFS transporter n=1 Tax=Amycolatopsis pigmentata TaxID=450801 RepID=A0ABW5G1K5_9PSEU
MKEFSKTRVHRAWWIAAVTGLVIVVTGASTGMPDLLTDPLQQDFGWSHPLLGVAFGIDMALYGVVAPFAAALMDSFGVRRVVAAALVTIAAGTALTAVMTASWQLVLGWGFLLGLGTGCMALTFAATVATRWFVARRGLVSGVLTSASMFGGMVVLPLLAWVVKQHGWRPSVVVVGLAALLLLPPVWLLLRDHPADLGLKAYGAKEFTPKPAPVRGAARHALTVLRDAARTGPFWLLVGSYGICGASTNGIMMTHFVPAAHEGGMPITVAASLLAVMGVCNVAGATGSGWLTDRFDPRRLLAISYSSRGVSLAFLPMVLGPVVHLPLLVFVVAYGLLDLATVPPTIALCRRFHGDDGPVVFGWVNAAHQLGAAAAAFLGGAARAASGGYDIVWLGAAVLCGLATGLSMAIRRAASRQAQDRKRPPPISSSRMRTSSRIRRTTSSSPRPARTSC